ncbi:uncharacterized protein [Euwallacea fornicatus]|uniref:uncharacterized protein isoform X2 n=1 Tax=Euwallacea fornicatus TaxID=995702 RepID=UPI00338FB6A2
MGVGRDRSFCYSFVLSAVGRKVQSFASIPATLRSFSRDNALGGKPRDERTSANQQTDRNGEKSPLMNISRNPMMRNKRGEIDLQTCIDNFKIHKDKIIRTQDSQNMGANFLNEIDLGGREECLRLCCETEECDVFVFEEKNAGSCYLFHCGPPEDFKCKFTHHVNYSSAVLAISRHLPDLESQIKLTKHVQDLSKLRKPEDSEPAMAFHLVPDGAEAVLKPSVTTTLIPAITREVLPLEKHPEARKCRRDQLECRSSGECIAIYNACDGIPQCADGSDEAPQLECPEVISAQNTQLTAPPPTRKVAQSLPSVHQNSPSVLQYGREGELVQQQQTKPQPPSNYQTRYHAQLQLPLQPDPDFLRPVPDPRSPGRAQFEPVVQVPNYLEYPTNNWGSRQVMGQQGMQQMPQYQDAANQVFTHKEKQFHNEAQISQLQYPEYSGRGVQNYYGENFRQPTQQDSWPMDPRYPPPQQIYRSQESPSAPILPVKSEGTSHIEDLAQEQLLKSENVVNPIHVQEKLAHDLKHSKDTMEHGRITQKIKVKAAVESDSQFNEPLKLKMYNEEGASRIPRGAILSLTLGLILTGVMAVLIGCRLRVVRRRLRKGGKGYAHDADYLVNGMYL